MSIELQILNPLDYPDWDKLVLATPNYSFFLSAGWARVLAESYKYSPVYFAAIAGNKFSVLVPFMEINSILTGRRAASLPFSDYCESIISDECDFQEILNYLTEYGKKAGWKSIELRNGVDLPGDIPVSAYCYGHTLDLDRGESTIFSSLRDSTKRNIKKAGKEGVVVDFSNSVDALNEFYRLNCLTRQKHGLPPQPYYFFEKIYEHIISKNMGGIALAVFNKSVIAANVYFIFGDKAIYKYGASDIEFQHLRANNIVMWEAIKRYRETGCKTLCFGRTEPDNTGLMQFKAGWGASERKIKYYKYDMKRSAFINDISRTSGQHNFIFSRMPLPLLKVTGALLYKHIG